MTNFNQKPQKWLFNAKAPLDLDPSLLLKPIKLLDKYERWRRVAKILKISKKAQLRLEWIIYYFQGYNVRETARHFGIHEFIALGNFHSDAKIFNQKLTEWLIEYNFKRPHEALGYKTPFEYSKVLPIYSSCTSS